MVLHVLPFSDLKIQNHFIQIILNLLDATNKKRHSYIWESLARANYLLSYHNIKLILEKIDQINFSEYTQPVLQNFLICCCSFYDYVPQEDKTNLLKKIQLGQELLNASVFNTYHPKQKQANVFIYIPDFLSGKSFLQQPLGELYASALLKENQFNTIVFDNRLYHWKIENVIEYIKSTNSNIVVVSTTPYDQVSIYYVDYRLNRILNDTKKIAKYFKNTVVVGSHGTLKPHFMLQETNALVIIKGEFEKTLLYLTKELLTTQKLENINNIVFLKDNNFIETDINLKDMYPEIQSLPMPDYDSVDMSAYFGDEYYDNEHFIKNSWGAILAQRGCPFSCEYCYRFFGQKVRRRTPEQVVEELILLEKKYKIKHVFFIDYTFTADQKWTNQFCDLYIKNKLNILWNCETRADCVNDELLKKMKEANCYRIWLGAETFSDELLKQANKMISRDKALESIKKITSYGIKVSCFFMIGLPAETKDSIHDTLATIKDLHIEYTKSIITVIPRLGARMYDRLLNYTDDTSFGMMNRLKGVIDNNINANDIMDTIETMSQRNTDVWNFHEKKKI